MTATVDGRAQDIKDIVCEILEIESDEVTETSLFKEDHGADSLRAIEIVAALERRYAIVIEQTEFPRMVNLRGVCDVVVEAAGR
ncbi:MAG TPA: acyl carrier protein [Micromonosporaceae bacterium]|nr:acyl carrier protein [Micromonosporaceae bacterium]